MERSTIMITAHISNVELVEFWSEQDPIVRSKAGGLLAAHNGAAGSSALLLVFEPGWRSGRHRHTAEETLLVLAGEGEMQIGDETAALGPGGLALVPAMAPHELRNSGAEPLRAVAFFPAAAVTTVWDEPLMPLNARGFAAPPPEWLAGSR
jgi:quercetin dioxygenase-like cupin family protein